MRLVKDGPKFKIGIEKYKLILSLRRQKKSMSEIARLVGMKKQGVSYYLRKYGDVDLRGIKRLDRF